VDVEIQETQLKIIKTDPDLGKPQRALEETRNHL
jgi:hypothetical protein